MFSAGSMSHNLWRTLSFGVTMSPYVSNFDAMSCTFSVMASPPLYVKNTGPMFALYMSVSFVRSSSFFCKVFSCFLILFVS